MQWWHIALIAAVSYLLGSINGSLLVSGTFLQVDIRNYGSGNAGTTNALRVMGKKWAVLVTALDLSKGALAVCFGYWLLAGFGEGSLGKLLAGVFAIAGHIFPLFYRFRGGKGVMTTAAIVAFVDWRVFLVVLSVFIVSVLLTRWVSLGSVLAAAGIPFGMYLFHAGGGRETLILTSLSAVMTVMVVVMHRENIGRILAGTERRFSFKGRAILETVKTTTAGLREKTNTALQKTKNNLKSSRLGARRRGGRKVSRRKLRKARRAGGRRPLKRRLRKRRFGNTA